MFNFFKWILGKPDSNGVQEAKLREFLDEEIATQAAGIGNTVKDLAFWCCVRRIGTAVASTEIKTMKNSGRRVALSGGRGTSRQIQTKRRNSSSRR